MKRRGDLGPLFILSLSLINDDGECSSSSSVMKWTISSKAIENTVSTIRELIEVRDGYKECIGFSTQELNVFMIDLCTGLFFAYMK